jgi:hypothetical protein
MGAKSTAPSPAREMIKLVAKALLLSTLSKSQKAKRRES